MINLILVNNFIEFLEMYINLYDLLISENDYYIRVETETEQLKYIMDNLKQFFDPNDYETEKINDNLIQINFKLPIKYYPNDYINFEYYNLRSFNK